MSAGHQIDYEALIDQSIKDFQPVKRLWPVSARLICWILLEATILGLAIWVRGYHNLQALAHNPSHLVGVGLLTAVSIVTAFGALKSAIPGRELTWQQLATTIAIVAVAFGIELAVGPSHQTLQPAPASMRQLFGLAALPWLALFWAAHRGVPLQPEVTGGVVGLAAFCFALALCQILSPPIQLPTSAIVLVSLCATLVLLSAFAGHFSLNWIARWQHSNTAAEAPSKWLQFGARTGFPLALSGAMAALFLVLQGLGQQFVRIPDFDLAIGGYEQALAGFRPNVPSTSMETMLTAYVEHGMPAYMWDFGPEGFALVGGRLGTLPGGTPVTYTWFRGAKGGVMCIFRQTDTFHPPSLTHDEHHHLLFYRYRDFSLCLINVGGYGNFISVIAAPMPLKNFEQLVLAATL
jgi:hypothetical protein